MIYFSIIKDIKPVGREASNSFRSLLALFAPRRRPGPFLLALPFFRCGDNDKSEKKIQTAGMVGRRDAILRLPGDKNVINERIAFQFEKNQGTFVSRRGS